MFTTLKIFWLRKHLHGKKPVARIMAVARLANVNDKRAHQILIASLVHQDENVQKAAADELGRLGLADAIDPMIRVLANAPIAVRGSVLAALGHAHDPRATAAVFLARNDPDRELAKQAGAILAEMPPHVLSEGLRHVIRVSSRDEGIGLGLIHYLSTRIGTGLEVHRLLDEIVHSGYSLEVRATAIQEMRRGMPDRSSSSLSSGSRWRSSSPYSSGSSDKSVL